MKLRIVAIHVALPLIAGITIYLLWRSPSLRAFHWLSGIGLLEPVLLVRDLAQPLEHVIPNWFLFSLPDGLWAYALSTAILLTWQPHSSRYWVFWFILAAALGVVSEFGQYMNIVPGTFEHSDVFCYAIGSTLPLLLFMRGRLHEIPPRRFRRNSAILRRAGDR